MTHITDMRGDLKGQGHQAAVGDYSSPQLQGAGAYCGGPNTGRTACSTALYNSLDKLAD